MSFEWEKHAECPVAYPGDIACEQCNADRAEMIAEGKRLEAALSSTQEQCAKLKADNETKAQTIQVLVLNVAEAESDADATHEQLAKAREAMGNGADDSRWVPGTTAVESLIAERDLLRSEIEKWRETVVIVQLLQSENERIRPERDQLKAEVERLRKTHLQQCARHKSTEAEGLVRERDHYMRLCNEAWNEAIEAVVDLISKTLLRTYPTNPSDALREARHDIHQLKRNTNPEK